MRRREGRGGEGGRGRRKGKTNKIDEIVEQMSLTDRHSEGALVGDVDYVDVEVIYSDPEPRKDETRISSSEQPSFRSTRETFEREMKAKLTVARLVMNKEPQLSFLDARVQLPNDLLGLVPHFDEEREMKISSKGSKGEDGRVVGDDGEVESRES